VIEHIKLPPQEWLGYDPERGDIHGYTFEGMREFAESIIRECIKQAHGVADLRGVNDDMIYGADTAAVRISKHFGVQ